MLSVKMTEDVQPEEELKYSIHKYSSYSERFLPGNILFNEPFDSNSRWSTDSNDPPQYLILKLEKISCVNEITFGKFEKSHVCNVKKVQIRGGLSETDLILLFDGELKNDANPETFRLKNKISKVPFAVRYIKIQPLQSWSSTFNCSIWYVSLKGCCEQDVVKRYINTYEDYKDNYLTRLCLKHLRHKRRNASFAQLQSETGAQLEHPALTKLYEACTQAKGTGAIEVIFHEAASQGLLDEYLSSQPLTPSWHKLLPKTNKAFRYPGMRGGHQLVCDSITQTIYLFGGWDSSKELNDLWKYHIPSEEWSLISADTRREGGPSPRSCHKMCIDSRRKQIFTMGRYLESELRTKENLKNELFMLSLETGHWTLLCEDTSVMGGPPAAYDQQMAFDPVDRVVYVFGGRVLSEKKKKSSGMNPDNNNQEEAAEGKSEKEQSFCGLYRYHVGTNSWKWLRRDIADETLSDDSPPGTIKGRSRHSMLWHPRSRKLFILAGYRKDYLTDFFAYDVDNDTITMIGDPDASPVFAPGPPLGSIADTTASGFTHKAVIDPQLDEIHLFSCLSKDREKKYMVLNLFWVYSIRVNNWKCIYHQEAPLDAQETLNQPLPRSGHQLVYDVKSKAHFVFGGKQSRSAQPLMRLDDFWKMELTRPCQDALMRKVAYTSRKQRYEELVVLDSEAALKYLRYELSEFIDHNNKEQVEELQLLARRLFKPVEPPLIALQTEACSDGETSDGDVAMADMDMSSGRPMVDPLKDGPSGYLESWCQQKRSKLFDELAKYFPASMRPPDTDLEVLLNPVWRDEILD